MPLLSFTAGTALPAASMNTIAKQVVITCLSSGRPSSPPAGMTIYETDTNRVLCWNGSAWTPPSNLPWGTLGYAAQTASQSGFATESDIAGVSVTFTAEASRRYRTTLRIPVAECMSVSLLAAFINDGGGRIGQGNESVGAGGATNHTVTTVTSGVSGSQTHKGRFWSSGGSATLTASAGVPIWIMVEDIGHA